MAAHSAKTIGRSDQVGRLVWPLAGAVAVVAGVVGRSSLLDVLLLVVPVVAFGAWWWVRRVPLPVLAVAVAGAAIVVQRDGGHEPAMFECSLLAFVVARWASSLIEAAVLGAFALAVPVVVGAIETHGNLSVGIWLVGIAFPWVIGRAVLRQGQLAAELEASRRALAERALAEERRQIARDVHDFVGHGLAAMMLQITSARHVLRRDPDGAEQALRSAELVGRRSMEELRRTLALLRSDEEGEPGTVRPPVRSARDLSELVADTRASGIEVELEVCGELDLVAETVGTAAYRIAQEALANAVRHAPRARTLLRVQRSDRTLSIVVDTVGVLTPAAGVGQQRHYGVVGMRERAAALGGELTAGPTTEGWRVSCRLPLGDVTPDATVKW